MATIMKNPVILPTSGVTVDMSTIKSHLLSDTTDPFNRKPLTLDMLQPSKSFELLVFRCSLLCRLTAATLDVELAQKIEQYIQERKKK